MITKDRRTAVERLGELFAQSRRGVAFTGAGISTECGIPDFRSPGGLWTNNQPIPFDEFIASQEMRNEAWRRKFALENQFRAAKPGRGHRALAQSRSQRQARGHHHAEHRQSAPRVRRAARKGDRAARQRHLRDLSRLCGALRDRLGARTFHPVRRRRTRLRRLRRAGEVGDHLLRPGNAGARDAAGRGGDARRRSVSCRSALRSWCGRRQDFP